MTGDIAIRSGSTVARVLPGLGFNCYSLMVDDFDYLHQAPDLHPHGSPTRSGIPVLFPWPNRIAGSAFEWEGTTYELPFTEEATGASLHGFACRSRWRVLETHADRVTGEFVLSRDAGGHDWPADAGIRVTYRVEPAALCISAEVFAADGRELPFGLGFHPYLRVPGPFAQWLLQCDANRMWPLAAMIPTGDVQPVPARLDFTRPRSIGDEHLDDVLTGLPEASSLTRRSTLLCRTASVTVSSDPAFREYVLFTPVTRDAVAIEPYTCATDAVHLAARGIDAGWMVLPAGATATFDCRIDIA